MAKSEMIYHELRDRIIAGRYTPGYRLILSKVAEDFGVSPVPVREALRRLEAEGLIEFTRNVGAHVSNIDIFSYSDSMKTLAYLEGIATAQASKYMTPELLDQASALNDQMKEATESPAYDPIAYSNLNGRFHNTLCSACPNTHLLSLITAEAERVTIIRRASFKFNPERSKRSVTQHEAILTLIREGAGELEIELAAREHKLAALRDFFDHDESAPSQLSEKLHAD